MYRKQPAYYLGLPETNVIQAGRPLLGLAPAVAPQSFLVMGDCLEQLLTTHRSFWSSTVAQ